MVRELITTLLLVVAMTFTVSFALEEPEKPDRYSLHYVRPGDTLWGIAQQYLPGMDPRIAIEWISETNGLEGAVIKPGDVLNVPCWNGNLEEPLGPLYSSPAAAEAAEKEFQKLLQRQGE